MLCGSSKWLHENRVPYFKGEYVMDFLAHKNAPSFSDPFYKPEVLDQGARARASKSISDGARAKA